MNNYALIHPRLDVVAIVTAPSAIDAMKLLVVRDETWGDVGLDEVVWLRKVSAVESSYSLFGDEDCQSSALIGDVRTEVARRRLSRLVRATEAFCALARRAVHR